MFRSRLKGLDEYRQYQRENARKLARALTDRGLASAIRYRREGIAWRSKEIARTDPDDVASLVEGIQWRVFQLEILVDDQKDRQRRIDAWRAPGQIIRLEA